MSGGSRFVCPWCGGVFDSIYSLKIHVLLKHRRGGDEARCPCCGRIFDTGWTGLVRHAMIRVTMDGDVCHKAVYGVLCAASRRDRRELRRFCHEMTSVAARYFNGVNNAAVATGASAHQHDTS